MNSIRLLIITVLFFSCSSAGHIRISGTDKTGRIVLEPETSNAQCEVKDFSQWSILFNVIPLKSPSMDEMFPDPDKAYRIYEKWTWKDVLISIPLAYISTVTKRSLIVETCELGGVKAMTQDDLNEAIRQAEVKSAEKLEETIKEIGGQKKRVQKKVLLLNGNILEGEVFIPKQKTDYIELGVMEPRPTKVVKRIPIKSIKDIK